MDLNALPDAEDEQPIEVGYVQEQHVESAVATLWRELEEIRRRLKREQQDEVSRLHFQQTRNDYVPQCKTGRHGRTKEAPQGWLECPAFGEPIDKIIPSKVPLGETFNESVPPGKRYSSKQVVNKQRKAGRDIDLVIDLTNTIRYYSPAEWTKQGIKHVKIPCKGRDAVPDNESVNTFVYENKSEVKVITNDDVLGDAILYDQQEFLRKECYQLLEMPHTRGHSQFPGSHPVSLNSDNLQLLRQRYYYATWKANGT